MAEQRCGQAGCDAATVGWAFCDTHLAERRERMQRAGSATYAGALAAVVAPLAVAAAAERERTLAQLSVCMGRPVEMNERGGVSLTADEVDALRITTLQSAVRPVSVFGIPIHIVAERKRCPECRDGKHGNCTHVADLEDDDTPIDCACGCLESRTCPSCRDVVPEGWTLDDHFNCNWPEDHQ